MPVAEFAEPGAENGAGAELEIEEPWEGYSRQDARSIAEQLAVASREAAAATELYETSHRRRGLVLQAAQRRVKELSGPGARRSR